MQFTLMPSFATSFESVLARPVTPARIEFDRIRFSSGCLTVNEVSITMRPHCLACMSGSTARQRRTTLIRFKLTAPCHCSSVRLTNGPGGGPPALANKMSTAPNWRDASSTICRTCTASLTSAAIECTSAPVCCWISSAARLRTSALREQITRRQPSRANSSATAFPRPRLAAVTSATLSLMPRSIVSPCLALRARSPVSCPHRPARPGHRTRHAEYRRDEPAGFFAGRACRPAP